MMGEAKDSHSSSWQKSSRDLSRVAKAGVSYDSLKQRFDLGCESIDLYATPWIAEEVLRLGLLRNGNG